MTTPTQDQIVETLKNKGINLHRWALQHDHKYTTVYNTVRRWAGRNDRTPHGGIARKIMTELKETINEVSQL